MLVAASLLTLAGVSHAVLTDNLTIGNAKALGLAHAVTADPPGVDSAHFNPAGLTRIEGTQSELKLISGAFNIELVFGEGYTDTWEQKLAEASAGAPAGFAFDESEGQTSKSEGAALMLPFVGLTNLPVLFAPLGGITYTPPDGKLTFSNNVYAPLMVGFSRADDDPGRFMGERLSFTVISYFAPSLAYKITDKLSVGGTVTFNYAGVGLDLPFREPNLGLQWLESLRQGKCRDPDNLDNFTAISDFLPCIDEEDAVKLYDELGYLSFQVENYLTFGINAGVLWDATPWLTLGAVYQSPIRMNMEGDFSWTQGDSLLNFFQQLDASLPGQVQLADISKSLGSLVTPKTEGSATVDMTMPDHFAMGASIQITPTFKFNVDSKFTRWSKWQTIPVEFSEPIGVIVIANIIQPDAAPPPPGQAVSFPLGLVDTWNIAMGAEYQLTDKIALRAGVEDRPSSIPKASRSPLLPIGDGKLYTLGAQYDPTPAQTLNFAIGTFRSSTYMPGNTSKLGNAEDYNLFIYNPYSGSDITANLDVLLLEMSYQSRW
jgi:long-subunit fatty acid transport protein